MVCIRGRRGVCLQWGGGLHLGDLPRGEGYADPPGCRPPVGRPPVMWPVMHAGKSTNPPPSASRNVFTGVCLSIGGEGVCLSACWDAIPPRREEPPRDQADPPRWRNHPPPGPGRPPLDGEPPPGTRQTPPGSRLQHTVYERPIRILLECILVLLCFYRKTERQMHSSKVGVL